MDGLKRQRKIFVRVPELKEKNANLKLIELGAVGVNRDGMEVPSKVSSSHKQNQISEKSEIRDPAIDYESGKRDLEKEILELLTKGIFTSKEILTALKIDWDSRKLTNFLKKNLNVKAVGGKPAKFTRNTVVSPKLFE